MKTTKLQGQSQTWSKRTENKTENKRICKQTVFWVAIGVEKHALSSSELWQYSKAKGLQYNDPTLKNSFSMCY